MSQVTYPLGLPKDLLEQAKEAAQETGMSAADVMRQALRIGIPKVRRKMSIEDSSMEEAIADTVAKLGPAPEIDYDKIERR